MQFFDLGIRQMRLIIGDVCNLQCGYCSVCDVKKGRNNMPKTLSEDMKQYLIWLNKHAGREIDINFFGGEPLIFFDRIKKLTEFFQGLPNSIYTFSITTNGKLMDEEKLKWFTENKVSICYSYDGGNSVKTRGYDVWEDKKDLILATEDVWFSVVMTSQSYIYDVCKKLQEIDEEYRKIHGHCINVNMIDVMENVDGFRDMTLTDIDLNELHNQYDKLFKCYLKYKQIEDEQEKINYYLSHGKIIDRANMLVNKVINNIGNGYRLTHFCAEYFENLSVDLDGGIYNCLFESKPFLHVTDGSEKILRGIMEDEYRLMKRKDELCRDCQAWPLCDGGCKNNTDPEGLRKWCEVQRTAMNTLLEIVEEA